MHAFIEWLATITLLTDMKATRGPGTRPRVVPPDC
jgi:hypothetical protein